ncbi:hypothetical protein A3J34_00355 [Candidatus Peribacteria bacterium RIFCSPLOWO2_02_FULL_51_10]|nr:MAG: hypothetical protein A3C52_05165 [Candidatus Peribacteria bacterium RIFCSPHIGHO2_02_FULL_51_15]OGJ69234.1 MAG: hypothetical protein A3J34_00355 [Candidatus Peribacteria bacterium RIFCSPLOWO2_02_FULL_51_10]
MEFNPHSLNQILTRIRDQMRCPQCGTRVAVDFPSIKLAGDDFMLLQLQCLSCSAFIVLHVNLSIPDHAASRPERDELLNASSTLSLSEKEMSTLRSGLQTCAGSFEQLFKKYGSNAPDSRIA